ncbi:hypothetical protein BJ322DRAFT_555470 [Thelephora terrestris]|uniref:Uncharacterized protein n=1 Tax=Thelephora terrestris TaxID=56493 RepID=A0A9P6LAE3_9AGAM|nr:hypothetical protein BJ322DRAFT_555470 [Thelephora terrestris]
MPGVSSKAPNEARRKHGKASSANQAIRGSAKHFRDGYHYYWAPHYFLAATMNLDDMTSMTKEQKGRDGALSTLDADIQVLNHAMRDTCGLSPAQNAFDCTGDLLAMIRVLSPLSRSDEPQPHVHAGRHGQRTGSRGSWVVLWPFDRDWNGGGELGASVLEATKQLTSATVAGIKKQAVMKDNGISPLDLSSMRTMIMRLQIKSMTSSRSFTHSTYV